MIRPLLAAALAAPLALAACAQPAPQTGAAPTAQPTTRLGQLSCDVSGGSGWIFGSTRDLDCTFRPAAGGTERYTGQIERWGVDVGTGGRSTLLWAVLHTGRDVRPGSLNGRYLGASGEIALGLGLGSNILLGGNQEQVVLQPVSIEGTTGLALALGVAEMNLSRRN